MKKLIKLFFLLSILFACESEIKLDKQISFELNAVTYMVVGPGDSHGWGDTSWSNPYEYYGNSLIDFNKSDYSDISSIVLSVPMIWPTIKFIVMLIYSI